VAALIAAINAALALQATLTSKSDERAKRRALQVAASTLALLKKTGWDPRGAEGFIAGGGADALMAVLAANRDDPETVAAVMKIMKALVAAGAPAAALKALMPHMKQFAEVVRDYAKADPLAAADALDCITALTRGLPEDARSAWEKEVLRAASLLSRANPGSSRVLAAIRALELEGDAYSLAAHIFWTAWAVVQAVVSGVDFDYSSYAASRLAEHQRRAAGVLARLEDACGARVSRAGCC
jgi:hypothetical protein